MCGCFWLDRRSQKVCVVDTMHICSVAMKPFDVVLPTMTRDFLGRFDMVVVVPAVVPSPYIWPRDQILNW